MILETWSLREQFHGLLNRLVEADLLVEVYHTLKIGLSLQSNSALWDELRSQLDCWDLVRAICEEVHERAPILTDELVHRNLRLIGLMQVLV